MSHSKPKYGFFDVDETIISVKSMFDFIDHIEKFETHRNRLVFRVKAIRRVIFLLSKLGVKRININKIFYYAFYGSNIDALSEIGRDWFFRSSRKDNFYIKETIDYLKELQCKGYKIVFVSGSFRPCLEPLAESLGIEDLLCTELGINDRREVCNLAQQAIGEKKAELVTMFLKKHNSNPDDCIAVGDDISDLDMLLSVGNRVIVPRCEKLKGFAKNQNWRIL